MATGKKITIIGAGLGGTLLSIYLARRGFEVEIYERRGDMRVKTVDVGRSINMTIAARGLASLEKVGLLQKALDISMPLKGRLVHCPRGSITFQPYGTKKKEVIHSILRNDLNIMLLEETKNYPNINLHFNHQFMGLSKEKREVYLKNESTGEKLTIQPETVVGADGAFSNVRKAMHRGQRADYQQDFLAWGYKEIVIHPGKDGVPHFATDGLHIWPRGDSLILGMPNVDGSLSCTCILPFENAELSFENISTHQQIEDLFKRRFPDVLPLVPNLADHFLSNKTVEMITTKTSNWHYKDWIVLLGDACHAIVPFYGQGMNITFEDCMVLDACLEKHGDDHARAFRAYQQLRKPNTDVVADLSKRNLKELRETCGEKVFNVRKTMDMALNKLFPKSWIPLYTLVAHTTIPIAEAKHRFEKRSQIMRYTGLEALLLGASAVWAGIRYMFHTPDIRKPAQHDQACE